MSRFGRLAWLTRAALIGVVLAALLVAVLDAAPAGPEVEWHPVLDTLGVTLRPATLCATGCWRLVVADYLDPHESYGYAYVWGHALDGAGRPQSGQRWTVAWGDETATLVTAEPPSTADLFPMARCFDWDIEQGPYRAWMGDDPARSDVVAGMGRPLCHAVNFQLTWQWMTLDNAIYLPLVGGGAEGAP